MAERKTRIEDFEAAALPHLPDMFRAARRLLGDPSKAEDLVQEVYLQAWKSFDRFQLGTNCRAWLYAILFNKLHHARRAWSNVVLFGEKEDIDEVAAHETPALPDHFAGREVLAALDALPPSFREVLLLADVEEFSYKETARILDIPIGTVMSRLSRARALLREQLAGVAGAYGIGGNKQAGQPS